MLGNRGWVLMRVEIIEIGRSWIKLAGFFGVYFVYFYS